MTYASYYAWFDAEKTPEPDVWDLEAGPPPVPNGAYFAEVFKAVEDILVQKDPSLVPALRRLRVVVTPNGTALPFTGPDVATLMVWDNWARVPRWNDQVGLSMAVNRGRQFSDAARMLPRKLGVLDVVDEARVRVEREMWARQGRRPPRDKRSLVAVPLGYAHQQEVPWVPWEDRDLDVYFAGSKVHNAARGGSMRRRLRAGFGNIKVLHREAMMEAVEDLRRALPDLNVRVDLVDGDNPGEQAESYSDRMARSRFVLDPRGTSRETYRYYESARVGAIPIVTSMPGGGLYQGAPGLKLKHWSELPSAVRRMTERPDEALALHEAMNLWWQRQGRPEAAAARLAPLFEEMLRRLG